MALTFDDDINLYQHIVSNIHTVNGVWMWDTMHYTVYRSVIIKTSAIK